MSHVVPEPLRLPTPGKGANWVPDRWTVVRFGRYGRLTQMHGRPGAGSRYSPIFTER